MRLETNTPIDKVLGGGLESDAITNVYGPPGSGKTNVALAAVLSCLESKKKVVYLDTEGSFSRERFEQMGGTEKDMKNIILLDAHEWKGQHKAVKELEGIVEKEKIGLIVVDSMVALYRLELSDKNFPAVNKQLTTQYSILSKIARTKSIPVLVTNHIYTKDEKVELTSRTIARYWSKTLIELKKLEKPGHRVAIVQKHRSMPEGKGEEFRITEKGLKSPGFL